jgi:hypothetical protein
LNSVSGIRLRRGCTDQKEENNKHTTLHGALQSRCQEPFRCLSPEKHEGSCDNWASDE